MEKLSNILVRLLTAVILELIKSGVIGRLKQAWDSSIIEPSAPNEDDSDFIDDAHADGWM